MPVTLDDLAARLNEVSAELRSLRKDYSDMAERALVERAKSASQLAVIVEHVMGNGEPGLVRLVTQHEQALTMLSAQEQRRQREEADFRRAVAAVAAALLGVLLKLALD